MIDLVIFDCDGVLIDSEPISAHIEAAVLGEHGIPIEPDEIHGRFMGATADAMYSTLADEHGVALPEDFAARVQDRLDEAFRADLRAVDGIHDALDRLGRPRCVASSSDYQRLELTLQLVDLYDRLAPHVYSAQSVSKGKPAPDLFLYAARQMGVPPARCLVVEDSENGIRAGVSAGMTVVGFLGASHRGPGDRETLRAAGASHLVMHMRDLPELVHALGGR